MKSIALIPGDILMDSKNSVWGNSKFEFYAYCGTKYCPMLACYLIGERYDSGNRKQVNIVSHTARIVGSKQRPYRNIPTKILIKMRAKGKEDAIKEFEIRKNTKTL